METRSSLWDLMVRFQDYQEAVGRAAGTKERYRYTFRLFERFLKEEGRAADRTSLTTQTMEAFAKYLRVTPTRPQHGQSQRAESGIHAHLRDLRAFTHWLESEDLLHTRIRFPMPKIPQRLFRILSDEELQRLWQSKYLVGNSGRSIRNRALVAFMLDTGLRREEVASLTLADVNLATKTVTVIGKGNKERRVFFSNSVREVLKEFLAIRGVDDEPLFHLSASGIRTTFRRIQLETGLEKFHPHQLRHQFATVMLKNTKSMEYVRLLLGHEDYNTTKRYLSLSDSDLQEAHEEASPFDSLIGWETTPSPKRRMRYSVRRLA